VETTGRGRIEHITEFCASGHPRPDKPHGRGDEQHWQREQPAVLDPLEGPEPVGRLVAGPGRVAVLAEILRESPRSSRRRVDGHPGKTELPEDVVKAHAVGGSATGRLPGTCGGTSVGALFLLFKGFSTAIRKETSFASWHVPLSLASRHRARRNGRAALPFVLWPP
jgi:hypothetical protein